MNDQRILHIATATAAKLQCRVNPSRYGSFINRLASNFPDITSLSCLHYPLSPSLPRYNLFLPCTFTRSPLLSLLLQLHLPMPPPTLILPVDLPPIRFTVNLCIPLRGFNGGAGVNEEEGGHGKCGDRGYHGLIGRDEGQCR